MDSNAKTDGIIYHQEGITRFISHIMGFILSRAGQVAKLVRSKLERREKEVALVFIVVGGVGKRIPCL